MPVPTLATVYLDNEPVGLMGDPKPLVSKIVVAGGMRPESVQVLRGRSANDTHGKPLRLEDTVDRTAEPTTAIYLTSMPKGTKEPTTSSPDATAAANEGAKGEWPPGGPASRTRGPVQEVAPIDTDESE